MIQDIEMERVVLSKQQLMPKKILCQTEHPLYASGGTTNVLALSVATTARNSG
jgi:hypothetical protein